MIADNEIHNKMMELKDILNWLQDNARVDGMDRVSPDLEIEKAWCDRELLTFERIHVLKGYVVSINNGPWTVYYPQD